MAMELSAWLMPVVPANASMPTATAAKKMPNATGLRYAYRTANSATAPTRFVMSSAVPIKTKLLSLEAGRVFAALIVAGYHVEGLCHKYFGDYGFDNILRGGYSGVEYFFVLSGFIIYLTHAADIGKTGALQPFLLKRFIRIVPMYWLVLGLMVIAFLCVPQWTGGVHLTPQLIVTDALLLPPQMPQILQPAWTLQREALFYLLFSLLIIRPRLGKPVFVIWQIGIIVNMLTNYFGSISVGDIFFGPHNLGFAAGIVIAHLYARQKLSPRIGQLMLWVGLASYLTLLFLDWHIGRDTVGIRDNFGYQAGTLLYTLTAMLIISGLVSLEQAGRLKIPTWAATLGGASYLIYLLHEPLSSFLTKIMLKHWFQPYMTSSIAYACYLIATLGAAILLHQLAEKPFLNALRIRLISHQINAKM